MCDIRICEIPWNDSGAANTRRFGTGKQSPSVSDRDVHKKRIIILTLSKMRI